jgi:hypothetical protein
MTEFGDKLALRYKCEEEGRQARAAGLPQFENPYHTVVQNEERSAWSNGWWENAPKFIPLSKTPKPRHLGIRPIFLGHPDNPMKVA